MFCLFRGLARSRLTVERRKNALCNRCHSISARLPMGRRRTSHLWVGLGTAGWNPGSRPARLDGSFRQLSGAGPRLTGCHVVALDLSGHGLSAHRAGHATYNIWDDLPQIAEVLDQLGWDSCVLLGHSRGAIIATLFAAILPEKVRGLIALDSLLPEPAAPDSFVKTLRAFVEGSRRQKSRPGPGI
ncbi:alpha/beta fold hydrolase [Paracoccus sp. AK26]|uniref:alpha/beta fold hydrolase n=1 Tax=Paracoccus sp. AK26 TaxID=2589076 RepID=UPI001F0AE78D|nr:alpha/beta fold hydrolase [Paracoccus sp. AK26]